MNIRRIPSPRQPTEEMDEVFTGWKQISNYLGMAIRTVQRYERTLGLPVHRPSRNSRDSVIGAKAELDTWVRTSPKLPSVPKSWLSERANRNGANFLLIDAQVALTFSDLALRARDEQKRKRTAQTARTAYDTIMRLRDGFDLSDAETDELDANLQRLKGELHSLGQRFSTANGRKLVA